MLLLRHAYPLPLRPRRQMRRMRLVHRPLPVLSAGGTMNVPTGDFICRLVETVSGHRPREVEFAARAEARTTWFVRSWFADGSRRDYRVRLVDVAEEDLREHVTESAFDRWPPPDIRGAIHRCRC
jgi:hypothetical protein